MDFSTIGLIVLALAVIAFFIFRRNRPAAHGTYDDPKVSSSGSIGGGPRAHDDPKVSSSGSIGGGPRAHDSRSVASGGSIGNQTTETDRSTTNRRSTVDRDERNARHERTAGGPVEDRDLKDRDFDDDESDRPTHNDRTLKSGGSFGSSS